jgi:hypothetical protein
MTYQYGTNLKNAKLNAINTDLGSTSTMKIFSGAEPANCAAADPTGVLVTINLPATPFATASGGAIALSGTWAAAASGTGTAASWRIYDSSSVCQIQGNVTDLTLTPSTSITSGQTVTITTFGITSGN